MFQSCELRWYKELIYSTIFPEAINQSAESEFQRLVIGSFDEGIFYYLLVNALEI